MQKLSNRMQVLHKKFAEQWLVLFLVSGLFISTILKIAEIGPDVSDVIVYILFDDKEYHTMKMTKQEWDYLCSAYRNYNSRLVLDESGNLNLLVG